MARATGPKQQSGSFSNISRSKPRKSAAKAKKASTPKLKKTKADNDADSVDTDAFSEDGKDDYEAPEAESAEELDSDALDEEDDVSMSGKKRKKSQQSPKKKASSPLKKRRRKNMEDEDEDEDEEDEELPEGLTVVGEVVRAPIEGRGAMPLTCLPCGELFVDSLLNAVPPGQISQNTLDFLKQMTKPECNDREW